MALFYRRDDDVQNGLGEAVPNIAVTYLMQPGLTPAAIYSDPAGTDPVANPQYTNGLGQTAIYAAAGLYTISYSGEQIQTLTYPDQLIGPGGSSGNTFTRTIPTPLPDGTVRIFTLGVTPTTPANDLFFVAGSLVPYETAYTVAGNTVTWTGPIPPQEGDDLIYFVS